MLIRYLGLARTKDEMAISLTSIQGLLLPGLQDAVGRSKSGVRIESYVEFETDNLVITARWGDNRKMLRLARSVIEDNKHIALLRSFVEDVMCGSKGSAPMTSAQSQSLAEYQRLAQQQLSGISPYSQGLNPADWNGYGQDLARIVRKAMADNQYKAEFEPNPVPQVSVPQISARELTKEELREKIARKLDLDETKITTAAEVVNHGRWRQIMDEVFKEEPKDEPKGEHDGERTEVEDSGGNGRKRRNTSGGSDAG